ncbi:YwdI family protein [Sutcliffiella deserti]|uniref:YwdI family protein n=1 Tax=Sutcliffiella deserti TaxID=2875501 RepID=UPI001CC0D41C|nr:YwdI family protein [Sutcliffiella deserti]
MSITLDKVLQRMQAELNRARETENVQKKREHLAAMKSLCELALETDTQDRSASSRSQAEALPYPNNTESATFPKQPIANVSSKPMKEDDANGDSLLDF